MVDGDPVPEAVTHSEIPKDETLTVVHDTESLSDGGTVIDGRDGEGDTASVADMLGGCRISGPSLRPRGLLEMQLLFLVSWYYRWQF